MIKILLSSSSMVEPAVQQSASDIWDCYIIIYIYIYNLLQRVYYNYPTCPSSTVMWDCTNEPGSARPSRPPPRLSLGPRLCWSKNAIKGSHVTERDARTNTLCFASSACRSYMPLAPRAQIQVKVGHGHLHLNKAKRFRPGLGRVLPSAQKNLSCLFDLFASSSCQWKQGHRCWNVDGMLNKNRIIQHSLLEFWKR